MQEDRTVDLDSFDIRLLSAIQVNARLTQVELAESVHLSPSQCQRRLKRLESAGIIKTYQTLLDHEVLGFSVMAMVNVSLSQHGRRAADQFQAAISAEPMILECWAVTGESDYLLKVIARNLKTFSDFLLERLLEIPVVGNVRSTILLQELKGTNAIPLT